jgi:hypothetical protein
MFPFVGYDFPSERRFSAKIPDNQRNPHYQPSFILLFHPVISPDLDHKGTFANALFLTRI